MFLNRYFTAAFFGLTLGLTACQDDDDKKSIRQSVDYSQVTASTPYYGNNIFVDADGNSTVDVTEGNTRLQMFKALNDTIRLSIMASAHIEAPLLSNMFQNANDPFKSSDLNASPIDLKSVVASSLSSAEAEEVRAMLEEHFVIMEEISHEYANTAVAGQAGKLGSYLVDEQGIEIIQVIQKSLIGALQLDYISNVLMYEGLSANNYATVSDHNYTELEHNWDVAYGMLTLNPIYQEGATADSKNTSESFLGSYIWEYNKANFANIHPAFLKGRVAIINNDRAELQKQATFIRTELENAIINAAIGYLEKWKTSRQSDNTPAAAHAFGEGLGFIYSLRFAKIHGGDVAFSDDIIADLTGSANGFWDLDPLKVNTAINDIKAKFNL